MTERNRQENVRCDLERVDSALRVARLLLNAAEFADSVSRACYGMFTAARALLLTEGLESKAFRETRAPRPRHGTPVGPVAR